MYCPNCEFEIKQEVSECPICGGELTEYPADGADATINSGSETQNAGIEKPLDTCISDLILDAKHELDSLDSAPAGETRPVEPLSGTLDFESILRDDSNETEQRTVEPFTAEPQTPSIRPDAPQTDEDVFSLDNTAIPLTETDDAPVMNESPMGQNEPPENLFSDDKLFLDETAPPADTGNTSLFVDEKKKEPPENLFSDDKLFLDETAPPADTGDTSLFVDEQKKEPPENLFSDDRLFLDETTEPVNTADAKVFVDEQVEAGPGGSPAPEIPTPEKSSDEPWSLQELSEPEPTDFIPETQAEHSYNASADNPAFLNIDGSESTGETEDAGHGTTGSRFKKTLVLILLFGVLFIAGVYALNILFPQDSGLARIKKEILAVMPAWVPWATPQEPLTPAKSKPQRLSENLQEKVPTGEAIENTPQQIPSSQPLPQPLPSDQQGETTGMVPENTKQQVPDLQSDIKTPAADLPGAQIQQPDKTSVAETVSADTASGQTTQDRINIPKEESPAPVDKPLKSSPETKGASVIQTSAAQPEYTIHVASFKANQIARKEVGQLIELGFDAYIETVDLGAKGVWHRVKVGHFANRAEAEQTVKSIRRKKTGVSPLIYKNK